jgi:TATA-box binding protein (TBP) (component of TFIID and TFIIIB)
MSAVAVKGKLYPKNVVSTYLTRIAGDPEWDMNLPAVAVVSGGKYGRGIFPAVVSKARIPIVGAEEPEPSAAVLYPLHKRIKPGKSVDSKSLSVARNKKLKALLHETSQQAPRQYITATDSQFKSGQNVVAGGTSVSANTLIAYMFIRRLSHDLDIDLRIYNMQTQNIVCSADLGYELNPEWIVQEADANGWDVYYTPEEFIGLTWITNTNGIKIVFVVFSTGKIVATGIKSMDQIPIAEKRMHDLIGPFRKGREPPTFDPTKPRIRDPAVLASIKSHSQQSGAAAVSSSNVKDNAAKRNAKKLLHEVKSMMKTLDIHTDDDDYKQFLTPFQQLESPTFHEESM